MAGDSHGLVLLVGGSAVSIPGQSGYDSRASTDIVALDANTGEWVAMEDGPDSLTMRYPIADADLAFVPYCVSSQAGYSVGSDGTGAGCWIVEQGRSALYNESQGSGFLLFGVGGGREGGAVGFEDASRGILTTRGALQLDPLVGSPITASPDGKFAIRFGGEVQSPLGNYLSRSIRTMKPTTLTSATNVALHRPVYFEHHGQVGAYDL